MVENARTNMDGEFMDFKYYCADVNKVYNNDSCCIRSWTYVIDTYTCRSAPCNFTGCFYNCGATGFALVCLPLCPFLLCADAYRPNNGLNALHASIEGSNERALQKLLSVKQLAPRQQCMGLSPLERAALKGLWPSGCVSCTDCHRGCTPRRLYRRRLPCLCYQVAADATEAGCCFPCAQRRRDWVQACAGLGTPWWVACM